MPRSSDELENGDDRSSRRRAVASRVAARRTGERPVAPKRAVRRRPEVSVEDDITAASAVVDKTFESTNRKAPTGIADDKLIQSRKQRRLMTIGILILIGVGASAAVGFTDQGEIDVLETIEARNERIRNNQPTDVDTLITTYEVPVQNTNERKADGGLKGRGTGGAAPVVPPVVDSASSTELTASSTDQITASSTATEIVSDDEETARPLDAPSEPATDSASTF